MLERILDYFFGQGIYGVIIVILILVLLWLQKRNDEQAKEIKSLNEKLVISAEKRVEDQKQTGEKFITLGKDLVSGNESLQRSVDGITRVLEIRNTKNI